MAKHKKISAEHVGKKRGGKKGKRKSHGGKKHKMVK